MSRNEPGAVYCTSTSSLDLAGLAGLGEEESCRELGLYILYHQAKIEILSRSLMKKEKKPN